VESGSLGTHVMAMQVLVLVVQLFVMLIANVVMIAHAARVVCVSIKGRELKVRTNIH